MRVTKIFSAKDLVSALIKAGELEPGQYGFKVQESLVDTLSVTQEAVYVPKEEKKKDGRKKS